MRTIAGCEVVGQEKSNAQTARESEDDMGLGNKFTCKMNDAEKALAEEMRDALLKQKDVAKANEVADKIRKAGLHWVAIENVSEFPSDNPSWIVMGVKCGKYSPSGVFVSKEQFFF